MKKTAFQFMIGVLLLGIAVIVYLLIKPLEPNGASPSASPSADEGISDDKTDVEAPAKRERLWPESPTDSDETVSIEEPPEFPALEAPGWHVWGTVAGSEGEVIAGAEVMLNYGLGFNSYEPQITAFTDASGIYGLNIPLPEDLLDSFRPSDSFPGTIEGRARIAGYLSEEAYDLSGDAVLPDPFSEKNTVRLDFVLERGAALKGRVFDFDGNPVSNAEVIIRKEGDKRWDDCHYTGVDGTYMIPIKESGSHFLRAVKFNTGTASAGPLDLETGRDALGPDLYLQGPGELGGTAVYPNGVPAGDLELYAYAERFTEKFPSGFGTSYSAEKMADGRIGLPFSLVTTDKGGRFRFTGLEEGRYFLKLDCFGIRRDERPELYETGRMDIRLVMDQHRLQVTLKDDQEYLVPSASLGLKTARFQTGGFISGGISDWYLIEPGLVSLVAYWNDLRVSKDLNVDGNMYENRVELIFTAPSEPGILLITATGYDGTAVPRIEVTFRRSSSGLFETLERAEGENGSFRIPAPPGVFDLEISEWAFLNSGQGYLPVEFKNMEVASGREIPLRVRMDQGGHLRLTVHLSPKGTAGEKTKIHFRLKEPEGRIALGRRTDDGGYRFSSAITPGVPWTTAKPLAPGSYCLELTAKGYEPAEVRFNITPGSTTEKEVLLLPE